MNKYEQLIEHIINDDTDKARELFHNIVVEKSRDIYESLIDDQDLDEVGGNQVEDLVDEVSLDEQGMTEEEEDLMNVSTPYAETNEEINFKKRVDFWKEKVNDILVSPFNYNSWTQV